MLEPRGWGGTVFSWKWGRWPPTLLCLSGTPGRGWGMPLVSLWGGLVLPRK